MKNEIEKMRKKKIILGDVPNNKELIIKINPNEIPLTTGDFWRMQQNNKFTKTWIDKDDFQKSGAFFIDRTVEELDVHIKKAYPQMPDNYKIEPVEYKFTLTNAFNQPREYTVYYYIVPPIK